MKLPPGTYRVSKWLLYATLTKERIGSRAIDDSVLSVPFTVAPGSVVHLGSFDISGHKELIYSGVALKGRIVPLRVTERDMQDAFARRYPKLASQAFRCVLCVDTNGNSAAPR